MTAKLSEAQQETVTIGGRQFRVANSFVAPAMKPSHPSCPASKPSKYKNVRTPGADGKMKASKSEARRDHELVLLERAGKICNLKRQPRFPLIVNDHLVTTYVGDWRYEEITTFTVAGIHREMPCQVTLDVVEDRKGALTKEFKIKWALAKALHPEIEWRLS